MSKFNYYRRAFRRLLERFVIRLRCKIFGAHDANGEILIDNGRAIPTCYGCGKTVRQNCFGDWI